MRGSETRERREERPEDEGEEEAAYLDELPEPLLLRVAELPAAQLVQACRLVCLRWKELVWTAPPVAAQVPAGGAGAPGGPRGRARPLATVLLPEQEAAQPAAQPVWGR